ATLRRRLDAAPERSRGPARALGAGCRSARLIGTRAWRSRAHVLDHALELARGLPEQSAGAGEAAPSAGALCIIRAPSQSTAMTSIPVTDPRTHLAQLLADAMAAAIPEQHGAAIVLERPKQVGHGDYASNLALQLAKPLKRSPRDIAQALVHALPPSPWLAKAEVAGAGFINLFLTPTAKQGVVAEI